MKLTPNVFKPKSVQKQVTVGMAGYDNPRENVDPHIKTKAISTKEITLSDGAAAGYVMNDASGVLTGGHTATAGSAGTEEDNWDLSGSTLSTSTGSYNIDLQTGSLVIGSVTADYITVNGSDIEAELILNTGSISLNTVHREDITGSDHSTLITEVGLNTAKVTYNDAALVALHTGSLTLNTGSLVTHATAIALNTGSAHTQGTDTTLGTGCVAVDHTGSQIDQVVNVCYGTGSTPPTASTTTEGTLFIQYIA